MPVKIDRVDQYREEERKSRLYASYTRDWTLSCISFFISLHNAIRPRGHSRHIALSSNPSMLIAVGRNTRFAEAISIHKRLFVISHNL